MVLRRLRKPYYWILIASVYLGLGWLLLTVTPILMKCFWLNIVPVPVVSPPKDFREYMVDYIRQYRLTRYDHRLPTDYSPEWNSWIEQQTKQFKHVMANLVLQKLSGKKNGFFVECGALDGAFLSNTLLLERDYNWTGLLIEVDPTPLAILKKRNRKAWVADICLSPEPHPVEVEMKGRRELVGQTHMKSNGIEKGDSVWEEADTQSFQAQCFPLDMLLAAINRTEVDYLGLDVEGVELSILKTIPFDKIHIKLISVEANEERKANIQKFLESVGYKKVTEIKSATDFMNDDLYELMTLSQPTMGIKV